MKRRRFTVAKVTLLLSIEEEKDTILNGTDGFSILRRVPEIGLVDFQNQSGDLDRFWLV